MPALNPKRRLGGIPGLLLAGVAPFILAEAGLRLSGWRPPEDPHLAGFPGGAPLFVSSGGFVRAAAGRRLLRAAPFPAGPERGALRIFSVGDSVTWGHRGNEFPDPLESYSEVLQELLRARLPGGAHRVVNCGVRTFATGRVEGVVREVLDYAPDAVILYAGTSQHIESVLRGELLAGREGWGGRLWDLRTMRALAALLRPSRGVSLAGLEERDEALRAPFVGPEKAFRDADGLARLAADAGRDLAAIAHACRARHVPLIIATVPSNLRFPPFATLFATPAARRDGEAAMRRIGGLLRAGRAREALAVAREASSAHPEAAGLRFLLARAQERAGLLDQARASYLAARDSDAYPVRALGAFNDAVRRLARRRSGAALADIERLFERAVPDGIPDGRLFLDNCHPRPEAHRLIAEELYRVLKAEGLLRQGARPARL